MKRFLKKRLLIPLAVAALGAVGVRNPELVAEIGTGVVQAVNGHTPDRFK